MGCLARIGCLIVLAVLLVGAWFTRNRWLPDRFRPETASVMTDGWQKVTPGGVQRTRAALVRLDEPRGPVFQTLSAGDIVSFALSEASPAARQAADSIVARVEGGRLVVRARVKTAELQARLGPLGGVLGERETVELSGTFVVVRPGLGGFVVQSAKVGAVALPSGMIPRVVQEVEHGSRPAALPSDAIPLPLPRSVGDIRVASGKVNVYKNTQ